MAQGKAIIGAGAGTGLGEGVIEKAVKESERREKGDGGGGHGDASMLVLTWRAGISAKFEEAGGADLIVIYNRYHLISQN